MQNLKTYPVTMAQIKVLANMASAIDYAKSHAHIAALAGMPEIKNNAEIMRDITNFVGVQHRILEKVLGDDAGLVYADADCLADPDQVAQIAAAIHTTNQYITAQEVAA